MVLRLLCGNWLYWARGASSGFAREGHRGVRRGKSEGQLASAKALHRGVRGLVASLVFGAIWLGDRRARSLAASAQDRENRLLVLRREAVPAHEASFDNDLLGMSEERQEDEPMIFYAVTEDGVEEVEIFLDERLIDDLCQHDLSTWRGVIEYIQDDLHTGGT
jgi:hypothetical protein